MVRRSTLACDSMCKADVTGLHVLDSPGLIPTSLADQEAARKIAMCNSIGDASYIDSIIAAQLIHSIKKLPDSISIFERVTLSFSLFWRRLAF